MATTSELLLFIPGMSGPEPPRYFETLVENFREYCTSRGLGWDPEKTVASDASEECRVSVELRHGDVVEYTIRSVPWSGQLPSLEKMSVLEKIMDGVCSIFYWGRALRMWQKVLHNKFMIFQIFFTSLVLLAWYYGVVALGIMALGANADIAGVNVPGWLETFLRGLGATVPEKGLTYGALFTGIGNAMNGFLALISATVLLKSFKVSDVAQTVYVTRCYLQDSYGLHQQLCAKVGKALLPLVDGGKPYNRVTVLAHSFGCLLAVESLADLEEKPVVPTRLVTLGSPLLLLSARCERLAKAVAFLLDSEDSPIRHWTDCFSRDDWLCAKAPIPDQSPRTRVLEIGSTTSLLDSVTGKSHDQYFRDAVPYEALLDPTPWMPPSPVAPV